MSKTCLVLGAAGFLGSHFCDYLLDKGYWVYGVDNLITGDEKNLRNAFNNLRFKFFNFDISSRSSDSMYIKVLQSDYIFNFASPASPIDFEKLNIEILRTGSLGTIYSLDFAVTCGAKYIMMSTSEVYGDPKEHPQSEDYNGNVNTTGVRSVYDEGKRFSEAAVTAYHRRYGIDIAIARIFNTYGPRMRPNDGRVIPNFISQALRGEDITVYGDGYQTRSFCYVTDLIEGIYKLSQSNVIAPINIGNPLEHSMLELANMIIEITGSKSKIVHKELPQHDPKLRRPDISKARKELDWKPKIKLPEGLRRTIEWFEGRI